MKALSISRPWTELILRSSKRVENRSWPTAYRGTLLVHGAQSWDGHALDFAARVGGVGPLSSVKDDYPTGLLGTVEVVGCCTAELTGAPRCGCGPWAMPGQAHWQLANPRPFRTPIRCSGALRLWTPHPFAMALARQAMAA